MYHIMYHKQMHQPCTKLVQITRHNNLSKKTYHNNLSHQSYQPKNIYSPRSITKTTLNHMHNTSKMCINQAYHNNS
jgi:hypothetical protein